MWYFVTLECRDDYTLTQSHITEANNSQLFLYLFIYSFIHSIMVHRTMLAPVSIQDVEWLRSVNEKLLKYEVRSVPHLIWYTVNLVLNGTWARRKSILCLNFMFEFPCITNLCYVRNQRNATLAVLFISNCKITLLISNDLCAHHQEYLKLY